MSTSTKEKAPVENVGEETEEFETTFTPIQKLEVSKSLFIYSLQ